MSQSVKLAGIITLLIILYFLARGLFDTGSGASQEAEQSARFTVLVSVIEPQDWRDEILVRGRTEADKKVIVRAETAGMVSKTPAALGALVSDGDELCVLSIDARAAAAAEARATLAKAKLDYDAAVKLNMEGFRSETAVAAARAARDQAAAQVERAEIELQKTRITAPFAGVFDHRFVEIGDFVSIGDPCGTVIQKEPFLVTGAVSEKDVGKISVGDRGVARLATGETVEGVIRFIAAAADPATRTFDVELETPNPDGALRDGVTAEFTIFAEKRSAHLLPRAAIVLNDAGEIGVRTADDNGAVAFAPVRLLGEAANGVWVGGLEGAAHVITRGQEFVRSGQEVEVQRAEAAS